MSSINWGRTARTLTRAGLATALAVALATSFVPADAADEITTGPNAGNNTVTYCVRGSPDAGAPYDLDSISDAADHFWNNHAGGTNDPRCFIFIEAGTYEDESIVWYPKVYIEAKGDITIRGEAAPSTLAVIGALGSNTSQEQFTSLNGSTITIEPGIDANGDFNPNQRGIDANGAALHVAHMTFRNFTTTGSGAAILDLGGFNSSGNPIGGSVLDCTFVSCEATGDGGAVSGVHTLTDCVFTTCGSEGSGGAVHDVGSLTDCTFTSCDSEADGGAIDEAETVTDCTFLLCTADGDGGGINDAETVTGCTFNLCTAEGDGGAVHLVTTVSGGRVDDCTADDDGGAIAQADTVTAIDIDDCIAGDQGGALYDIRLLVNGTGSTPMLISDCVAEEGGGIASSAADVTFVNLFRNEATEIGGGAMYLVGGDISRCRVISNSATRTGSTTMGFGGGFYRCDGRIENSFFADNFAARDGGALLDCDGWLRQLTVVMNDAGRYGGGARGCNGIIRNSIFLDNTAGSGTESGAQLSYCAAPLNCGFRIWAPVGGHQVRLGTGGDPEFVDWDPVNDGPEVWDLDLQSDSPFVDKGRNITLTTDYYENDRPETTNGKWDIGAHEVQ